jgi:hypothetical protein
MKNDDRELLSPLGLRLDRALKAEHRDDRGR